jgi:3-dehydroquinate synthase
MNNLGEEFFQNLVGKVCVIIEATEITKSYTGIEPVIEGLIEHNLKRDSHLVAIGGGITQDITCFIADNFMRGISWSFVPTTLLAQSDSCIGSKSSINFNKHKNILGSFTPPKQVIISNQFLSTLSDAEIRSGVGEIIKLYLVDGLLVDKDTILKNLTEHLSNTLQIKKRFIEEDEFDRGIRNILNYGHCFGHAIESATDFAIPHGIAVSMGMDIANKIACQINFIDIDRYNLIHKVLFSNYQGYETIPVSLESTFRALSKDKKNSGNKLNVILPEDHTLIKFGFENNQETLEMFSQLLKSMKINFVD